VLSPVHHGDDDDLFRLEIVIDIKEEFSQHRSLAEFTLNDTACERIESDVLAPAPGCGEELLA